MGGAGSVQSLYEDATKWFQMYIDKDTYLANYEALDKDADGGITIADVHRWVSGQAKENPDSCWSMLHNSGSVLMMSHKAAAMHSDSTSSVSARSVVNITEFRALLIHMFANSVLWRHFLAADEHSAHPNPEELYRKKLSLKEFRAAYRSLCEAHKKEELTRLQIEEDFRMVDANCDNLVGFVQICTFCAKYIHIPIVNEEGQMHHAAAKDHHDLRSKASRVLGVNAMGMPARCNVSGVRYHKSNTTAHGGATAFASRNKSGKNFYIDPAVLADDKEASYYVGGVSSSSSSAMDSCQEKQTEANSYVSGSAASDGFIRDTYADMHPGQKRIFAGLTPAERTSVAMEQMRSKIIKEDAQVKKFHAKRMLRQMLSNVNMEGGAGRICLEGVSNTGSYESDSSNSPNEDSKVDSANHEEK